jgi:hypothetical protein
MALDDHTCPVCLKAEVERLRALILEYEVNSPGCQSNLLAEAHRILAQEVKP